MSVGLARVDDFTSAKIPPCTIAFLDRVSPLHGPSDMEVESAR
jgi:hypothetical protein